MSTDASLALEAPAVTVVAEKLAADSEASRGLQTEVVDAITRAGFPRHFVATRWGGTAGTFADWFDAVATVARGDMASAWCAALWATHARIAAQLRDEAQEELWGDRPDSRICISLVPSGEVREVNGGYSISGEWGFCSGIAHADWLMVGGTVDADGAPEWRLFLVAPGSYEVLDTWHNVGLKGTGSHHVRITDLLVPAYRSCRNAPDDDGLAPGPGVARCHAVPYRLVSGITFVGPMVGGARRALEETIGYLSSKRFAFGGAVKLSVGVQTTVARAAAMIDAAELLIRRAVAVADGTHPGAEALPTSRDLVLQNMRDFAAASEMLRNAVDLLFRLGGARGQHESNVMQRIWRDVNSASGHVALGFESHGGMWARHAFGIE